MRILGKKEDLRKRELRKRIEMRICRNGIERIEGNADSTEGGLRNLSETRKSRELGEKIRYLCDPRILGVLKK